ncbi:MAG: alanine racemase [Bacteroidales bacterium]
MAELIVSSKKIIQNIERLNSFLVKHNLEWSLVVKVLAGHREFLELLLNQPIVKNLHSIADSRLSGLRKVKEINPSTVTMYVRPPAMDFVRNVVSYADISLNSSFRTIEALDNEAARQGKIHRIVIMIELGELREGVIRENVMEFYQRVFNLQHIKIEGIGTNLGCMYGVQPTYDKLLQLSLYKQLIEVKFNTQIPLISGGSSITLPLVGRPSMPRNINHIRVGEAVFLGTSPFDSKRFKNLHADAFEYSSNIIELEVKGTTPDGIISDGNIGHTSDRVMDYEKSYRAILDFGLLDVDVNELKPKDQNLRFVGTTSDMSVYDLGPVITGKKCHYRVGDKVKFIPSYMAVARLMNSKFIDKKIVV